jgi:uncharacterized coiled-coil protein SlyX
MDNLVSIKKRITELEKQIKIQTKYIDTILELLNLGLVNEAEKAIRRYKVEYERKA